MESMVLEKYFELIHLLLLSIGAVAEKKFFRTRSGTFLYNKVLPFVFFSFWLPMGFLTTTRATMYAFQKNWEKLMEITHMTILGWNSLYLVFAFQKTAPNCKNCMDMVKRNFIARDRIGMKKMKLYIVLMLIYIVCYIFSVTTCIVYKELFVDVWVPFVDNDKELPQSAMIVFGFYQGLAAIYMFIINGFLAPFVIVMTSVIIEELNFLMGKLKQFDYYDQSSTNLYRLYSRVENNIRNRKMLTNMIEENYIVTKCSSESDTKRFVRDFVQHQLIIEQVISEVSKIYKYVFLTQYLFTITHSCFLAFNLYYTQHRGRILVKYSPYLMFSYYLLYMFCWNGQRLSDTCEELCYTLYTCPWYNCPHSFKKSLLIMMQFSAKPVKLVGGGVFTASVNTFLNGVQQSISYLILLQQLTPENKFH